MNLPERLAAAWYQWDLLPGDETRANVLQDELEREAAKRGMRHTDLRDEIRAERRRELVCRVGEPR